MHLRPVNTKPNPSQAASQQAEQQDRSATPPSGLQQTPTRQSQARQAQARQALAELLLGDARLPLPNTTDIIHGVATLCGTPLRKVTLPLADTPAEIAFTRHRKHLHVSCYETHANPDVRVSHRPVPIADMLHFLSETLEELVVHGSDQRLHRAMLHRAHTDYTTEPSPEPAPTLHRQGGQQEDPGEAHPLSFGFRIQIPTYRNTGANGVYRADTHALLLDGDLWLWSRGKRLNVARGPILLALQRMIAGCVALVDAHQNDRKLLTKLTAGNFLFGVQRSDKGVVNLTLGSDHGKPNTIPHLDMHDLVHPVLRVGADIIRALVNADRSQLRNLRIRNMRDQVRQLRKSLKQARQATQLTNIEVDRWRTEGLIESQDSPENDQDERNAHIDNSPRNASGNLSTNGSQATERTLRFGERWQIEVPELDACSTFLCGDRLVLATPRRAFALDRNNGDLLWSRPTPGGTASMIGTTLLLQSPEGELEFCDVEHGDLVARGNIEPQGLSLSPALRGGGPKDPPLALVTEGPNRLAALDMRHGEMVWRLHTPGSGPIRLHRCGRILLAVSGEPMLQALDVRTGEPLWRTSTELPILHAPSVVGDTVTVVAGTSNHTSCVALHIHLISGEILWSTPLDQTVTAGPIATQVAMIVPTMDRKRGQQLVGLHRVTGNELWRVKDPGLFAGAASLRMDNDLMINSPSGLFASLDTKTGEYRWSQVLADYSTDELPRTLEPILRGAALFVPSSRVHSLRPSDGLPLGPTLECDLVPDFLRVDERGWIYVAEESGVVSAHAPVPHLKLIR